MERTQDNIVELCRRHYPGDPSDLRVRPDDPDGETRWEHAWRYRAERPDGAFVLFDRTQIEDGQEHQIAQLLMGLHAAPQRTQSQQPSQQYREKRQTEEQ